MRHSTIEPITNDEKLTESQIQESPTKFNQTNRTETTDQKCVALEKSELMTEPKQADPECKDRLFKNVRSMLTDFRKLEAKRKNLSMRFDFCLTEIFTQVDTGKTGY